MATNMDWLTKHKKAELGDLARHVGLKEHDKMKKSDLETALESHLKSHRELASDTLVAPFYDVSPVKQRVSSKGSNEVKRRQTLTSKVREEIDGVLAKTPRKTLSMASRVPLPPSPAVLASKIENQTMTIRKNMSKSLPISRLGRAARQVRGTLSSSSAVNALVLMIEAWGLRGAVLPFRHLLTIPSPSSVGGHGVLDQPVHVLAPDMFALLTFAFWGPVTVWLLTSFIIPLIGGWVFNFRLSAGKKNTLEKSFDTVSFNIVKAILVWIVYLNHGIMGSESVNVVRDSVPGGANGMVLSAAVGIAMGLYEAVLRG